MILTCPSCQARYVIPDSAIGSTGRKVRCARCRHSWFQEPLTGSAGPSAPPASGAGSAATAGAELYSEPRPAPPPEDYEPIGEEPPFGRRQSPVRLWLIIAVVLAVLLAGAIGAIWYFGPTGIGQRIGLPARDEQPLTITGNIERRQLASGNELLEVRGEIINVTDQVQRVPQIRAELKDAQDRVVYAWSIAPPVRELQPRGRVTFNSANVDVPRGGRLLSLTFGPVS